MNTRQKLALERYCRFAFETLDPALAYQVPTGLVVLSVDTGYE